MEASFFQRHPAAKDVIGVAIFIACVIIGTVLINSFIFRSFSVVGPSMESTLFTGDRLIIDRIPVTIAHIQGKQYLPQRGQIIVFLNPQWVAGSPDQYIVKRVIGLPGEHVVLKNGSYTIYNNAHPDGFNPDKFNNNEPGQPASGEVDEIVPQNEIFVSGDHRQGDFSYDSRNGLGTIPSYDIIGPVSFRIFPFTKVRGFLNEGAPY